MKMDMDEFSDDGLDDIPDNAFQELENNAIRFTQAHQVFTQRQIPSQDTQPRFSDYGWEQEDDDLDTAEVTNDAGVPVGRPVVDKTLRQQNNHLHHHQPPSHLQLQHRPPQPTRPSLPPAPNPRWNPAIDPATAAARAGASLAARPQIGSQVYHPGPSQSVGAPRPQASQFAAPPLPSQAHSGAVFSALQQRVRALEADLNAARGEAAILRSNSTKTRQEYDANLARLRKINAEQQAKQERAVEAALAAEKSANTELQFLQRDMKEVTVKARRKDPAGGTAAGLTTPKKNAKTWGIADGFDEMDIASSPSKAQGRNKNAGSVAANIGEKTPTKGKRKRLVNDSPIKALDIHTGDVEMGEAKPLSQPVLAPVVVAAPTAPFDFLQLVLDHGYSQNQPPTFDILSRISFPSDPAATSISTIIFEKVPLMGDPGRPMQLLVDFAEQITILWTKCIEEQFWIPIKYLASLIAFTFQLQATAVAPLIMARLVPVAQSTVFTIAAGPTRLPDGTIISNEEFSFIEQNVDTIQILSLLYTVSVACATIPTDTEDGIRYTPSAFWRLISLDVVILLLIPKQKMHDTVAIMDLLATSSLPDSIGPIAEEKNPVTVAREVIDRVSVRLTDHPRPTTTPDQRRKIRLVSLRTLISFARHPFGAQQLASHDNALPRLVTCLSTSIDDLYDQSIPSNILPPLPDSLKSLPLKVSESSASADLYRIISQCVLLIHTLVTDPCTANLADITRKLSLFHGGSQRYIIALGRLTFAEEDLVIEAGIEGEVVEAAHELLEMAVTPDEGETVSEAFGA